MTYNFVVALLSWQLILPHLIVVDASTHWVVTEDGRIQAQMDSIFNMKRPYDLMALLKQEQRAVTLENLKQELLSRKADIDSNEDKDTGIEQRFYRTDPDCVAAGKPLVEFELYQSTLLPLEDKGIRMEDHIDFSSAVRPPYTVPQCTDYVALEFSMHAFEHLEGIKERTNLSLLPELGLKSALPYTENIEEFGHRVHTALLKNKTSWVLHNMAAFYWRVKGDANQAIECLRRALHFSQRNEKDVALVSLSNILHQAHYSNEAAIVIHASIDISRELNVNHFTLGNIYAVLAEYNKSVICFENALRIQPNFDAALRRRHAVLCHARLETVLESQHRSLQRTLAELRDYQQKHEAWKHQQQKLVTEQASRIEKIDQTVSYETYKMRLANEGVGEHCGLEERDGHHVLQCAWARVKRVLTDYDFAPSSMKEQKVATASEKSETIDYNQPNRPPLYRGKKAVFDEGPNQPLYLAADWPSKDECDQHAKKFPMWNEFPTTYLPAENKGFEVRPLLGSAQGLQPGQQHPFPWYPPVCTSLADIPEGPHSCDHITSVKDRMKLPPKMADPKMKSILLATVEGAEATDDPDNDGLKVDFVTPDDQNQSRNSVTQDEIGQRILTALKKKIGPSWVLYNLAALYWRIVGNSVNGIECARRALYFVPDQFRDVPLLNLANILYRVGRVDDAIAVMREALVINDDEPESHFFMGNLLAAVSNLSGSVHHYRQALAQNPLHRDAYASMRIIMCYQKFHRTVQSAAPLRGNQSPSSSVGRPKCPPSNHNPQETVFVCTKSAGVESCFLDRQHEKCSNRGRRSVSRCVMPMPPSSQSGNCVLRHQPESCITNNMVIPAELSGEPLSDTLGTNQPEPDHMNLMEDMPDYYNQEHSVSGAEECDRSVPEINEHDSMGDSKESDGKNGDDNDKDDTTDDQEVFFFHCDDSSTSSTSSNSDFTACPIMYDDDPNKFFPDDPDAPGSPLTIETHSVPQVVDPIQHIQRRISIRKPSQVVCEMAHTPVNFEQPFTISVSLTTKLDDTTGHIDMTTQDGDAAHKVPKCDATLVPPNGWPLPDLSDRWNEIMATIKRQYKPELEFTSVLLDFDGLVDVLENEPTMSFIGSRLALALKFNATSWVVTNLVALYWRVQGRADLAVDCIAMAYHFAPTHAKDIALLSLASIMHHCGLVDDALLVTMLALDHDPDVVALHFMLANLYAAKGQFKRATLFYESTLGIQSTFEPAIVRLATILCWQVLGQPPKPDKGSSSETVSKPNVN